MNYDRYYTCDLVNGEGIRLTLFVTGCQHACAGCYNSSTWDRKSGKVFSPAVQQQLLDDCERHDGLSLSGGDPLHPRNRDAILQLCQAFKARFPQKNIWLWTGYLLEEVQELEIINYLDVLIDGKYDQEQPSVQPWRGSDNQHMFRIHAGVATLV